MRWHTLLFGGKSKYFLKNHLNGSSSLSQGHRYCQAGAGTHTTAWPNPICLRDPTSNPGGGARPRGPCALVYEASPGRRRGRAVLWHKPDANKRPCPVCCPPGGRGGQALGREHEVATNGHGGAGPLGQDPDDTRSAPAHRLLTRSVILLLIPRSISMLSHSVTPMA